MGGVVMAALAIFHGAPIVTTESESPREIRDRRPGADSTEPKPEGPRSWDLPADGPAPARTSRGRDRAAPTPDLDGNQRAARNEPVRGNGDPKRVPVQTHPVAAVPSPPAPQTFPSEVTAPEQEFGFER
jgi:hypothetical protein